MRSKSEDQLVQKVRSLDVWKRGGQRAPHKPLLLLMALARLQQGKGELPFSECRTPLTQLLREFGPTRNRLHPEYPFWRLQKDGLWEVRAEREMKSRESNTDVKISELEEANAVGRFPDEMRHLLLHRPALIERLARELLDTYFPHTLHEDIAAAVGLSFQGGTADPQPRRRRRDPNFRNAVLIAYEYKCAVCGFDVRHGALSLALDAAHIKWHQADGPDEVSNSLCLCVLHHKLFDYGAFHVDDHGKVLVSERVTGTNGFESVLLRHHGQVVQAPVRREHRPARPYVAWHHEQVFKRQARPLV